MISDERLARRFARFERRKLKAGPRCGAQRHRDGQPCEALPEPGKRRCRFHGGRSTGPRTPEGKAICTRNLPRNNPPALWCG